jgi:glutamate--cysteine ligase catalytic subunit
MVSPLHPFPGPLHPYSNHQSSVASSLPAPSGGLLSPPESRRTSGDEKEQIGRPHARQSLPSIQEALGPDPPLPYPPPPPSAPVPAPQSFFPPSSTASAVDHRPRNFSVDHINNQGPPNPFSQPRSPFANKPASTAPPPPPTHVQTDPFPRTPYSSNQHNSKLPTLHPLRTTQSPPVPTSRPNPPYLSYPHQPSPANEAAAPHSAGPMNPQYPYPQYHPNHPFSAPAQSGPNARYPPSSATYSAPPLYPPPSWRSDGPEFGHPDEKKSSEKLYYGVSVKRHLESFDLEASLNEVSYSIRSTCDPADVGRWPKELVV